MLRGLLIGFCLILGSFFPGLAFGNTDDYLTLTTDKSTGFTEKTASEEFDLLNEFRFVFTPSEDFEANLAGCDRMIIRLESDHQLIELIYGGFLSETGATTCLRIEYADQFCQAELLPQLEVELDLKVDENGILAKVSQQQEIQSLFLEVPVQSEPAKLTFVLQKYETGKGTCSVRIREAQVKTLWESSDESSSEDSFPESSDDSSFPNREEPGGNTPTVWSAWHYVLLGLSVAAGCCLGGFIFLIIRKKWTDRG